MKESISNDRQLARRVAELVAEAGGRAYFVGGCVRDRLLGEESKDIDIEVHGISPEELKRVLDAVGARLEMGASFGVFGLKGSRLDIAMPRKETATGGGHRDFDVLVDPFLGVEKAASRRDFTVNAIMQDALTGEILDPFHGREDLQRRVLRHVKTESFGEDPLRVLRAAQFSARLGFSIAGETRSLCAQMELSGLSRERVWEEMKKALLKADTPSIFFTALREMDQLGYWFPELQALIGVPQSPSRHQEGDAWNHTLLVLDEAARRREETTQPLFFLIAALCHDMGKAVCTLERDGEIHAYGHETLGVPVAEAFLNRLTSEKKLTDYALNMVRLHMKPGMMAAAGSRLKKTNRLFDDSVAPEDLLLLSLCDGAGKRPPAPAEQERFLRERLQSYRALMQTPEVTGRDLLAAGLRPGKEFQTLLRFSHELHLSGVPYESALRQTLKQARTKANGEKRDREP